MGREAGGLVGGWVGLFASQSDSVAAYCTPPTMTTFVAPAARTESTNSCIPDAWKLRPVHVPPSRQQRHASGVFELLSGNGSLNRSKITRGLPPYAAATSPQNFGGESR